MTASDQNKPEQPENVTPAQGAAELPGIAHPDATAADISGESPDATEEQLAKDAAAQKRRQFPFEILDWEDLLEEMKLRDPRVADEPLKSRLDRYANKLNNHFRGSFVIPKVDDSSKISNADLFADLIKNTRVENMFGTRFTKFVSSAGTGTYQVSHKGISFKAGKNAASKQENAFTEVEARQIATLAMHNADLLPPGSLKITGNPQQRAMIFVEIEKLNQLLPENARMIVRNAQDIDMKLVAQLRQPTAPASAPASPAAPAAAETEAPESQRAFKTATEARNFTPEEIAAAQDNFSGKTPAGTPPTATENTTDNAVAIEEVADDEAESGLKNGKDGPSIAEQQLQKMQERINSFSRQEILDHAKKIGVTETRHHVYSGKIRIEDAPHRAFTEVLFTAPKKGERQIISIEKTDFYEGYQSDEISVKRQPKDKLDAAFPAAASGESTRVSTSAPAPTPKGDEPRLTA